MEIDNNNYLSYTHLNIVAFSFAHGGAMGDPGGIIIIDAEGQTYHANYAYGDNHLDPHHINDVIPVFSDIKLSLLGGRSENDEWEVVNLGYGNTLVLRRDLSLPFHKAAEDAHFEHAGQLYQQWERIVLSLLRKG